MPHTFLEIISTNYRNYQTLLSFSKSYYQTLVKTFFNAETLLQNNTTDFFRVHTNQLLIIPNKTDVFSELLLNNSKDFFRVDIK